LNSSQTHGSGTASAWIQRWSNLVAAHGTVLDVACGYGRHMRWFASRGHGVVGVDRAAEAIESLADLTSTGQAEVVQADIENLPWPFMDDARPRQFDGVVVTNYLWRPLLPTIVQSLAPGGVLLYETFATGNASVGKPSRPDFLLATGELLQICTGLRVVAYEDGYCEQPSRFVQRIVAVRTHGFSGAGNTVTPPRFPL
jgi:SAM-dependent methyltransferase